MRYLSVCSGIEAASVAWQPLGWEPWAFAEVDAFPSAVLAHHYPNTPNLGDLNKWETWPDATIDLLVGGTPCQSFSVAGLRKGLADPRGGLLYAYLAVARRYRPRWVVWENVPGVLSIDGGRAFGTLLGGLAELGYGVAYRVLDAQYFGVAQRRRRVFVVGCLGSWSRAAAVLFERSSLSGHPAPRREAPLAGTANGGGANGPGRDVDSAESLIVMSSGQANAEIRVDGGTPSLTCLHEAPIVAAFKASHYTRGKDGAPSDVAPPLSADADKGDQDTLIYAQRNVMAFDASQIGSLHHRRVPTDLAGALRATAAREAVAHGMTVRRLTPRECERLQGFSDDYTLIPYRGKPAADGPRYKALGNSMAVPCMALIGRRIQAVEAL